MTTTLITGAAGFIGSSVAERLLARGDSVLGIDNINDYYTPQLKHDRLKRLGDTYGDRFRFVRVDFADMAALTDALDGEDFAGIVHLGAQAGVRYSIENPHAYVQSNLVGHLNLMEVARHRKAPHLVYASSSSVYGGNKSLPFRVEDRVDHPLSLYAATKKADELMSETYANLYRMPQTGLRFFTVYGPWGRPDMAPMLFASAILEGRPIKLYNEGRHSRDFTFIDDIVEGVVRASDRIAEPDPDWDPRVPDPATSSAPFRLYNIGNSAPVQLLDFIEALEDSLGRKAERVLMPLQPGDALDTYADSDRLARRINWRPATPVAEGVARFAEWYKSYANSPTP